MKLLFLLTNLLFILCRCERDELAVRTSVGLHEPFEIALHKSIELKGSGRTDENNYLGRITFSHLDDSRCPANAMCIRQGAAVTTFKLTTTSTAEAQTVRMFIGDFMPNDPRQKRNLTADTVAVQLANKAKYRLILKQVAPYPGTGTDTPRATLLLERQ